MPLFVHHGPQLGPLAAGLVRRLAEPGGGVPSPRWSSPCRRPGVRDWLTRRLAADLGVAANIEMPFPGGLFAKAIGLDETDDPWNVERRHVGRARRPRLWCRRRSGLAGRRRRQPDLPPVRRRQADRRPLRSLRHQPPGDSRAMASRPARRRHRCVPPRPSAESSRPGRRRTPSADLPAPMRVAVRPVAALSASRIGQPQPRPRSGPRARPVS